MKFFLDQQQYKKEYMLLYQIIETTQVNISQKTVWHKLRLTHALWRMILEDQKNKGANWDVNREITGESFIWATSKYLTLLELKGAIACNDE